MVQTQYLVDPKANPYRDAIIQQITNRGLGQNGNGFSSLKDRDRNEFTESSFNRLQPFVIHEVIRQILGNRSVRWISLRPLRSKDFTGQSGEAKHIPEDFQHLLGTLLVNEI